MLLIWLLLDLPAAVSAAATAFNISDTYYLYSSSNVFYSAAVSSAVSLSNSTLASNVDSAAISVLAQPPDSSSLILGPDGAVYAFHGYCSSGKFHISTYSIANDSWSELELTDSTNSSYRKGSIYFNSQDSRDPLIYIFGGVCSSDGELSYSNSLSAYNSSSSSFVSTDNPNPPIALAYAAAVSVNNQTVMMGGKAFAGWIGMSQLAIWDDLTWSYQTVNTDGQIDSRTAALALANQLGTEIIVIGGYVDGRAASPTMVKLDIGSDNWSWSIPEIASSLPNVTAATILPGEILLGITSGTSPEVFLLNITTWSYISSYSSTTLQTALKLLDQQLAGRLSSSNSSTSSQSLHNHLSKGILAAIIVCSVIAGISCFVLLFVVLFKWYNKYRQSVSITPNTDKGMFLPSNFNQRPLENDETDSYSDNDGASTTTWEEKRRRWIKHTLEEPQAEFAAGIGSNEPGTSSRECDSGNNSRLSANDDSVRMNRNSVISSITTSSTASNESRKALFGINRNSLKSFRSGRKSAVPNSQVQGLTGDSAFRGFRRRSTNGRMTLSGAALASNRPLTATASSTTTADIGDDDDVLYEMFKDREVQVLVSTRRKGQLKVMNPDEAPQSPSSQQRPGTSDSQISRISERPESSSSSTTKRTRWLVGSPTTEVIDADEKHRRSDY
ncbi:uncharacterized protein V1516DRAFT_629167 [Lipomyces oligophaga]|uniref:uncharacterized protein n=1 Tax=Lipomyces oligophaga TaxID=45792 RepID=UPI0034CF4900